MSHSVLSENAPSGAPTEQVSTPRQRRSKKRMRRGAPPLRGLIPLILFLAAWQVFGTDDSPYFPRPGTWWSGLTSLWSDGSLLPAIGSTLETFAISLVVAAVLGALLGALIGARRLVHRALNPTLEFLRAMPSATVVPIFVLLIGYDQKMKVTVVVFTAIWPIMLNTMAAVRSINPILLDMAASLHMNWFDRMRKVLFPSLLPAILLGVRVAAPVTLIITLLVEILTAVSGVGALIATAQRNFQSATVFALVVVSGLFGLLVNAIVAAIEAYTFRYRPQR
jgi:ABC-type nitrate/sulfonate/bicarbonate transport system permease component